MINIYCTQKLIAKLPVNQGLLQEGEALNHRMDDVIIDNPLSGWHGNILTIHRRQCVLLVHNKTRFPVFMIGLTKPDFASLDYLFADTLMNTLLKVDANEEQMQVAQQLLEPLFIDKTNDRSVQGTLNQMKSDFEHKLYYDDVNIMDISNYKTGAWLANRPCTVKGKKDCVWPIRAMLALLDEHV